MTARQPDGSIPATPPPGAARRPRRLGRPWRVAIHSTVYCMVACLALLTILRAAGWETALPPLLAITPYASTPLLLAATPYVGILVGACMIVALAARMRVAAVVTVVLLAAHLAWFVPRVSAEPRAGKVWPAARVRVMTANLYADRTPASELVAAVRAEQPDVLALQEAPPEVLAGADRAGLRDLLPYRVNRAGRPGHGGAIYARRPLRDAGDPLAFLGRGLGNPRATLELAGTVLTVQSVHTNPPMPLGIGPWQQDLRVLGQVAAGTPEPLIAMGDYNASSDHRSFRALLAVGGLRDADDARGRGLVRTWPTDRGWRLPAFAQLDHVLVSRQLAVLGVHERTLPGTDHRAVIADLALSGNQQS